MEPFVDEAVARQVRFGMQGCSGSRSLALCLADERNNNSHCRVMAAGAAAGRWRAWGVEDAAERGPGSACTHTACTHTVHATVHCTPGHTTRVECHGRRHLRVNGVCLQVDRSYRQGYKELEVHENGGTCCLVCPHKPLFRDLSQLYLHANGDLPSSPHGNANRAPEYPR